jgi:hypothetical protein
MELSGYRPQSPALAGVLCGHQMIVGNAAISCP